MARPLSRRWIAIVGGIAVVAVIVAAAVLSTRDDTVPGGTASEASGTVQTTGTTPPSPSSSATEGPPAGASVGAEVGGSGSPGATTGQTPAATPQEPAAAGSALTTITTPPSRTLAMIEADRATPDSRYDVVFQVYGFGPGGAAMALVVKVGSSNPIGAVDKPYDFKGRNVLVRLARGGGGQVTVGGTYRGVIQLRPDGSVLVPVLSDVRKDS